MAKIRPLSPTQAKSSFAARFAKLGDRIRQLNTNFGIRPYRVSLVWIRWTGVARGEGDPIVFKTIEILPTPRVDSLDAVSFSLFAAGALPVGSIRISEISPHTFTSDLLRGLYVPDPNEDTIPDPFDFFWEVVEDGRADPNPERRKFRLLSTPLLRPGKLDWMVALERVSLDRDRDGNERVPQFTP